MSRLRGPLASPASGLLVLATLIAAPTLAAEVRVLVTPESGITVGDPVRLVLEVDLAPEQQVSAEASKRQLERQWLPEDLEGVELVSVGEPTVEALEDGSMWRRMLTLRSFRPGPVELPSVQVPVSDDLDSEPLRSAPVRFSVESVLPEGAQTELQPPALVRQRPLGTAFWAFASLLAAVAVGSAVAAGRAGAFASEEARRSRRDPLTELQLALQAIDPRHPERGHVGLSSSLRRFLERRAGTPALERTTTEIYRDLGSMRVEDSSRRQVRTILLDCDCVKFGGFTASRDELSDRVRRTRSVAKEIEATLSAHEAELAAAASTHEEAIPKTQSGGAG